MAQAPALPRGFELPLKQRLPRIGSIDQVAVEARAGELAKRSIKKESKLWALELAIRCCDLTTLEGQDTPGKVAALCSKAIRPDPTDPSVPSVAAVCVYPNLVPAAKERLARHRASRSRRVATAFPSGQSPLDVKLREVEDAVALGADEIDMVIDRGAFLSGRYAQVYDEIVRVKEACGEAHLKVILEVVRARHLRQRPPRVAARDGRRRRLHQDVDRQAPGRGDAARAARDARGDPRRLRGDRPPVGMKPAGGIRTSKNAIQYLVQVHETLGPDWLTPDLYRLGASCLAQRHPDAAPQGADRRLPVEGLLHE